MSDKQLRRWERIRAKGQKRHTLWWVVMYTLIPIASTLLYSAGEFIFTGRSDFSSIRYREKVIMSFFFGVLGYVQAQRLWRIGEENYRFTITQNEVRHTQDV